MSHRQCRTAKVPSIVGLWRSSWWDDEWRVADAWDLGVVVLNAVVSLVVESRKGLRVLGQFGA